MTGDHRDTARAIAKRLGILRPDQRRSINRWRIAFEEELERK